MSGSRWARAATLAGILALAATLRIWGMDYGLPHPVTRPDEERIVGRAHTIFATGNWHTGSPVYPSLVYYLDTFAMRGYYEVQRLRARYDRPFDFLFDVAISRPGLHYRIARSLHVAVGVLTVGLTYLLSWSAYRSRPSALLAAAALAVCLPHVIYSHFATTDVVMTFFVAAALVLCLRAGRKPSYANFVLAAAAAGLATSSKYNAGLVCLSIAAAGWNAWRAGGVSFGGAVGRVAVAAVASVAVFAATSPFVLPDLAALFWEADYVTNYLYEREGPLALWNHLQTTFPRGLGLPGALFAAAGVVRALYLRRPADWVLLAFLLSFFALISSVRVTFPRYTLALLPGVVVVAADAVDALVGKLRSRRALAWAGAAALVLGPPLWSSIQWDRIAAREDTRLLAWNYLAEHVPPQTLITLCGGYGAPHVNEDRRRPPAFRVERFDCNVPKDDAVGGAYVVTHEHRQLDITYSDPHPSWRAWLEQNARGGVDRRSLRRRRRDRTLLLHLRRLLSPLRGALRGGARRPHHENLESQRIEHLPQTGRSGILVPKPDILFRTPPTGGVPTGRQRPARRARADGRGNTMSKNRGFNRRSFLRGAGLTAVAGAMGPGAAIAGLPAFMEEPADGRYDFDTPYDRSGTHCFKWDYQYTKWGEENVQVGMGIADMDFRAAPCIGKALAERSAHENWGYMVTPKAFTQAIVDWNQRRYGLELDPDSVVISSGVHPGLVAALRAFAPEGSEVILSPPTYNAFYTTDLKWSKTKAVENPLTRNGRRELFDGLRRPRVPYRPRHPRAHPVQPAEPHRELLVQGRPDASRSALPRAPGRRFSRTRSTATSSPRDRPTRRSRACPTRTS